MHLTQSESALYNSYLDACKRKVTLRQFALDLNVGFDYLKRQLKALAGKVQQISKIKTRPAMAWPKMAIGSIPRKYVSYEDLIRIVQ